MADRTVSVRLSVMAQDYIKAMKDAANATATVGTEAEKLAQKKRAFEQLGATGLTMGTLLAAGFAAASKASMDFDAQMSNVQAATHESAENMGLLRQAALDAGEATVFSATEAAQAIEELSKAGVSTADILGGGLTGSLDLAAAGGIGVADAAGIAATALKQFNLNGSDMSHVADLLAAGAGKAMGDVTDLSQALNQSALVAKQTGLSIEETTAGLSAFAAQGLLGSDAGTSFKSMLQALNPTSAQAADLMEKYNLQAYDAQGNFVGLAEYAGKLKTGLSGLSTEQQNATLKTIFGADAVRAATVLYQNGAEGITEWTEAVDDQGYAAETARMRLDNLKGDIEALGGAFETALIDTGSAGNDVLRTMAQALTGLISMYNDLPEPVQASVLALGGAAAAVALTGGAAFLAVPKWLEFKATVEASTWSMKGIGLTAAGAGLALGGLFMIVGELAAEHQRAQQLAQSYADTLSEGTHEVTDATRDLIAEQINLKQNNFLFVEGSSMADAAKDLGISLDTVRKAIEGDADALDELNTKTQDAIDGYNFFDSESIKLNSSAEYLRETVEKQTGSLEDAAEAARNVAEATAESADTSDSAAEAYITESDAVAGLNSELGDLIDRINEANGIAQDAVTANAQYQAAVAGIATEVQKQKDAYEEAHGTLEGFTLSLNEATVDGSANAAMLSDVARAAEDAAKAQFEQDLATMSADDAAKKWNETLAAQKQAFIDSAVGAGYNAQEVQALADRIFQMPTEKEFNALVETAEAQAKLDNFVTMNNGRTIRVKVAADGASIKMGSYTVDAGIPGQATGGPVIGPGTATSDSVLRRLSNGEHIVTADEVRAAGGHGEVEAWRASLTAGSRRNASPTVDAQMSSPSYYGVQMQPASTYSMPQTVQQTISLDGMAITGTLQIGGDGLATIIDGRIQAKANRDAVAYSGGTVSA
jgi:TP901 family phage tail tape measure protein